MSTYKLTYFNSRGGAETIRFIFAQAGVAYEDNRVTFEEWPKLKPTTPYKSLPVLEVDGKQLAGSRVIQRLLAERFGLAGSNDFENAEITSIVETGADLAQKMGVAMFLEKDETRKEELKKELFEVIFPKFWGSFEKLINANNAPEGWIYGSKVTHADFALYNIFDYVKNVPNLFDNYPGIRKMMKSVEELPSIAKWIATRPTLGKTLTTCKTTSEFNVTDMNEIRVDTYFSWGPDSEAA